DLCADNAGRAGGGDVDTGISWGVGEWVWGNKPDFAREFSFVLSGGTIFGESAGDAGDGGLRGGWWSVYADAVSRRGAGVHAGRGVARVRARDRFADGSVAAGRNGQHAGGDDALATAGDDHGV